MHVTSKMKRPGASSESNSTSSQFMNWVRPGMSWSTKTAWSCPRQEGTPTLPSASSSSRTQSLSMTLTICMIYSTCTRTSHTSTSACSRIREVSPKTSPYRTRCSASFSTRTLRLLKTLPLSSRSGARFLPERLALPQWTKSLLCRTRTPTACCLTSSKSSTCRCKGPSPSKTSWTILWKRV